VDQAEARRRAGQARVARLATVTGEGRPHLVPITFALDGDLLVTAVDAKPKRDRRLKRLANIAANPAVSVLVDAYAEDWSQLWWVRVDGTASIVERGEPTFDAAVELLVAKYAQYAEQRPAGPVIAVAVEATRGWSAS
jgi:PPOX class probable F420-dependent enzyme